MIPPRKKKPAAPQFLTSIKEIYSHPRPERVLAFAPSILSADFANLEADLRRMMRSKIRWAHLDVMDGHFVPNITFGPPAVKSIRAVSPRLYLDTHLMVENPMQFVDAFVEAGSDSITIHAETVKSLPRAVAAMRRAGVRVGVSIKPRTPLKILDPILDKVDLILIMTVEPGFGGQSLLPGPLNKVRQLARRRQKDGLKFLIQIDGGLCESTIGLTVAAGANILVGGSAIFGGKGVGHNLRALTAAAMKM